MGYGDIAVASEAICRQLIDGIVDCAVIRLDAQRTVRSWHLGAERLTGYPAEEILGRSVRVFYPDDEVGGGDPDKDLRSAAEAGRYETEGWRVRKDGSRYWALTSLATIREPDGSMGGFVAIVRDGDGRRDERLAALSVEQMLDAITDYEVIRLDLDGVVRSWSPGARRLKQYDADDVLGHHVSMFYTDARGADPR